MTVKGQTEEEADLKTVTNLAKDFNKKSCVNGFLMLQRDMNIERLSASMLRMLNKLTASMGPLWPLNAIFVIAREDTSRATVKDLSAIDRSRVIDEITIFQRC